MQSRPTFPSRANRDTARAWGRRQSPRSSSRSWSSWCWSSSSYSWSPRRRFPQSRHRREAQSPRELHSRGRPPPRPRLRRAPRLPHRGRGLGVATRLPCATAPQLEHPTDVGRSASARARGRRCARGTRTSSRFRRRTAQAPAPSVRCGTRTAPVRGARRELPQPPARERLNAVEAHRLGLALLAGRNLVEHAQPVVEVAIGAASTWRTAGMAKSPRIAYSAALP